MWLYNFSSPGYCPSIFSLWKCCLGHPSTFALGTVRCYFSVSEGFATGRNRATKVLVLLHLGNVEIPRKLTWGEERDVGFTEKLSERTLV